MEGGGTRGSQEGRERERECVCVCVYVFGVALPAVATHRCFAFCVPRSNLGADKKVRTFLYYVLRQEAFEKGELRDVRLHSRGDNSPTSVQRRRSHRHAVAAGGEKPDLSDDDDEV